MLVKAMLGDVALALRGCGTTDIDVRLGGSSGSSSSGMAPSFASSSASSSSASLEDVGLRCWADDRSLLLVAVEEPEAPPDPGSGQTQSRVPFLQRRQIG